MIERALAHVERHRCDLRHDIHLRGAATAADPTSADLLFRNILLPHDDRLCWNKPIRGVPRQVRILAPNALHCASVKYLHQYGL
jgi:hypothetical protein